MGTRVPVQQYNLRSADSYIDHHDDTSSLHNDLNTVDGRSGEIIEPMVDRDTITDDNLDNEVDSAAAAAANVDLKARPTSEQHQQNTTPTPNAFPHQRLTGGTWEKECMHQSYQNTLPLHNAGGQSSLDTNGPSLNDISPIETAKARFMDFIVDNFISTHVVEATESETDGISQPVEETFSKRKGQDVRYEGDPQFVLPLMYVANLYETLINEVNMRLHSLNGWREKTFGVGLEAAGGLYRKLAKKFPKKGSYSFKRRELATSFETRSRFPELVVQEEKRIRFIVVNGLAIIEKPTIANIDDAEWFKRLTGRGDVHVSPRDYKFYAPRHKYRRPGSNPVSSIPGFPAFPDADNSSPMSINQGYRSLTEQTSSKQHMQSLPQQGQFDIVNQNHQSMSHDQHGQYSHHNQCGSSSHLPEIGHTQGSAALSQQMACLQPLSHLGGRLHVLPTSLAKFCDECGTPYLRETSKFCSECGAKRLGI